VSGAESLPTVGPKKRFTPHPIPLHVRGEGIISTSRSCAFTRGFGIWADITLSPHGDHAHRDRVRGELLASTYRAIDLAGS
jgi:hypothetical protein